MAKKASKIVSVFDHERDTKNKRVYRHREDEKTAYYIPKTEAARIGNPDTITVTITPGEEE